MKKLPMKATAHPGVAVIDAVSTDNKNRTAGDHTATLLIKRRKPWNQRLCKLYVYQKGYIMIEKEQRHRRDELMMVALDAECRCARYGNIR